jgi:hypothetical protein
MLLELVANRQISKFRRVPVPTYRMAAGPVSGGARADFKRHPNSVTCVEARTANFG